MKKEKTLGFVMRKEVLGAFLVLFLIFGFYSVKLMSAHHYVVSSEILGTYTGEGTLNHAAFLNPNTLYGYLVTMDNYPIPLVDRFLLTYTYKSNPVLTDGTYHVTGTVEYYVNKGNEEVVLWEETLFDEKGQLQDGGFTVKYVTGHGRTGRHEHSDSQRP